MQAIYPDIVTWSQLPDARGVELRIRAPVTFDEPIEALVYDWSPPPPVPVEPPSVVLNDTSPTGVHETERAAAANSSSRGSTGGRRPRAAGRGRGGKSTGQAARPLTATAKPFESRRVDSPAPRLVESTQAPMHEVVLGRAASVDVDGKPRIRIVPARQDRPTAPAATPLVEPSRVANAGIRPAIVQANEPQRLLLSHLPSIVLTVHLPTDYPDASGPSLVRIEDEDVWLGVDRRRSAETKLAALYSGDECLLSILDCVSPASSDFPSIFSIDRPLILRQPVPAVDLSAPRRLSDHLAAFDRNASAERFATSSHLCPLCFANQRGSACIRLASCGCAFCVDCLRDYFSLLITEGLVRSVACPSRGCVEKRAQWEKNEATNGPKEADRDQPSPGRVTASEVERLVGSESRERWEWLIEKARVESGEFLCGCSRRRHGG